LNREFNNFPNIEDLSAHPKNDDLFICALGFEARCTGALRKLVQFSYKATNSIVLKYDIHQEDNEINLKELYDLLNKITLHEISECKYLTSDIPSSYHEIDLIIEEMKKKSCFKQISVDISSFNTSAIFQILDKLFQSNCEQIRIIYTESKEYYPKEIPSSNNGEYLSAGIKEVLTLPNFSGIFSPGYTPLLVIILGFEPIRARGILNIFQPSKKIGIFGVPSRHDLKWRLSLAKKMYQNFFEDQDIKKECSEFNYEEVYWTLEKIYNDFSQKNNVTIAPLGSKMQALAVLLFLEKHPDVQLLISIPIKYDPRRYSEGVGKSYQIIFKRRNITILE